MARRAKETQNENNSNDNNVFSAVGADNSTDISGELIKALNKELGSKVAYNLSVDESPTHVKRWISTGSQLLDYILSNRRNGGVPEGRIIEISGPPSCHAEGETVLMFNGSIKKVEDIKIGDELMGPNSKPRSVLEVFSGEDELYKVTTRWRDEYIFNSEHLLALTKFDDDKVNKISIKKYNNSSKDFRKRNLWFQPINGIEYSEDRLSEKDIDPYILGILIGDGSIKQNRIELTSADNEISNSFIEFCKKNNYGVGVHQKKDNRATGYYIKSGIHNNGKALDENNDKNRIRCQLRNYGLLNKVSGNKFIPEQYKITSRNNRLELLAGLIDTDGYLNNDKKSFEYVTKSEQLSNDFEFLCRSLGFATTKSLKLINNINYHRIYITGNIDLIPTRVDRKKVSIRPEKRTQHNRCSFSINSVGRGKFYGFTVNEDNLYLSSRFGVIHNCGKSHISYQLARTTQRMGGLVVYIDTENATPVEKLATMGLDVSKRFVYCDTHCTEEVFSIIENTIIKAKSVAGKDIPILVIWDSVAATSPRAELDGEYDKDTIGLQARVLSKGMRKITGVIGQNNVTLLMLNQNRQKIGVMFGDPTTTPGGMAIPYHASIRLKLTGGSKLEDKHGNVIGINVAAQTIKNKVAQPFRKVDFIIEFGKGIVEGESIFDLLRAHCEQNGEVKIKDKNYLLEGAAAWKTFRVSNSNTGEVLFEKKFTKSQFDTLMLEKEFGEHLNNMLEVVMVIHNVGDVSSEE